MIIQSLLLVLIMVLNFLAVDGKFVPHIVFILADDLGWNDLGFRNGNENNTSNIDKLASSGLVLEDYYTHTVCSPSRATIFTGKYSIHHGINRPIDAQLAMGLSLKETTLSETMQEAGYATHYVGKWHLGFYKWEYTPTFRGFDSFYGYYSGVHDYFEHTSPPGFLYDLHRANGNRCGPACSEIVWEAQGHYSTRLFSAEAVAVIESHTLSKPLFLFLAYQAVHSPAQVPSEYVRPYEQTIQDKKRRLFAGMVSALDEGILNVTNALSRKSMLENTLIIFASDNGGVTTTNDGIGSRNWPLRGGKHSLFEGGTKVNAFLSGYGVNRLKQRNYFQLMHAVDWLPTLAAIAGYNLPSKLSLDGVSHWDSIRSGRHYSCRRDIVYGEVEPELGTGFGYRADVGSQKWKLLVHSGGKPSSWCNTTTCQPRCSHESHSKLPCPNGSCLFRLDLDEIELHECSKLKDTRQLRQELLLRAKMIQAGTRVTVPDPSCPPFMETKILQPWC